MGPQSGPDETDTSKSSVDGEEGKVSKTSGNLPEKDVSAAMKELVSDATV
ncbi:hypothetical protein QQS21_002487 [Conoideocrella luteorostrata]|uniref:Uncharacterized protein n=1 Tax=Conoideocrella luteorostrata TaxID=1105319 RepID=A0AAJ0CV40_9HYPO|nr:hypothetical protein QQS21_002487 [Conoideocrella luteorostrata]